MPDPIIRSLGVPLVTGDIPGVAVVLGKADNAEDVANVVKDYQSKGILTFMITLMWMFRRARERLLVSL